MPLAVNWNPGGLTGATEPTGLDGPVIVDTSLRSRALNAGGLNSGPAPVRLIGDWNNGPWPGTTTLPWATVRRWLMASDVAFVSSVADGWTESQLISGPLTNLLSWVDLTSANFSFDLAKSDGSDLRVYDADLDAFLPVWLMDYSQSGQTGRIYFLASDLTHAHWLYYGNPSATAVSSHADVFTHGSGFDADFGDLTTAVGANGYAQQVPASTGPNDSRNYRVWSIADADLLDYAMTGFTDGSYTGVRETSLIRDAVTNKPIQIGGKYYITFARRSPVAADKIDSVLASGPTVDGPWSNFTKFYSPPGTVRLGYPSSCIKVGSTYVLHIGYGWDTGGAPTPGLTVYTMTSTDLATWTSPVRAFLPSIWTDPVSHAACTDCGNAWTIRCADGVYMMVVEAEDAASGLGWKCYGATASDPVNGPWTALNGGAPLVSWTLGAWDGLEAANPKVIQLGDGSYAIQYNGADNTTSYDWQLGFATAANRGGPWTKATYNPVAGRVTPSYGVETSAFHLDTDGSILNWAQRFGDSGTGSSQAKIYRLKSLQKEGGLLVSTTPNDAAAMGVSLASGGFTAESRSILTAHRASGAAPIILGLWDYAAMPAAASASTFAAQERVEIVRWSHDWEPAASWGRGDVTFRYWDTSGAVHYWNGAIWMATGTNTARNLPADHGREVVASISDDGTNYLLKAVYADDGSSIGSALIAKASVKAFSAGRLLVAGDPFTDTWGAGAYFRYLHTRPYAASDPVLSLGPLVSPSPPVEIDLNSSIWQVNGQRLNTQRSNGASVITVGPPVPIQVTSVWQVNGQRLDTRAVNGASVANVRYAVSSKWMVNGFNLNSIQLDGTNGPRSVTAVPNVLRARWRRVGPSPEKTLWRKRA